MDEAQFETLVIEELEGIRDHVLARKDALFVKDVPITHEGMARAFALGAAENAMWNLLQRARGTR